MDISHSLERMARKFARRIALDDSDREALFGLPFHTKMVEAGRYLVREGSPTEESALLLSGFAVRHKLTADGDRQIVSVHIPGDFVDLEGSLLKVADHNVQTLTGVEGRVRQQQSSNPGARNELSVRMELQADCYAGVWGYHANKGGTRVQLDPDDADEALNAAAAIGDDRLQRMQSGRVAPERFTHGTSQQRVEWFRRGMSSGDPNVCNTFQ